MEAVSPAAPELQADSLPLSHPGSPYTSLLFHNAGPLAPSGEGAVVSLAALRPGSRCRRKARWHPGALQPGRLCLNAPCGPSLAYDWAPAPSWHRRCLPALEPCPKPQLPGAGPDSLPTPFQSTLSLPEGLELSSHPFLRCSQGSCFYPRGPDILPPSSHLPVMSVPQPGNPNHPMPPHL